MKRTIIVLILSALLTINAIGQKPYNPIPKSGFSDNQTIQTATDTLFGSFFNGTPALYKAQNVFPGYASGNNSFGDRAKAQVFSINNICAVEGAIVWMGYKNYSSGDVNSKVNFNLYGLNTTVTGQGVSALKQCPDTIYRSSSLNMIDIDTSTVFENGANVVTFNTPAYFDTLFAIGFDFTGLAAGDTIACYTTTHTDADSSENSWEMAADSTWGTMFNNWNLDVDFAIFPIIDGTQTGLPTINSLPQVAIYPNPANTEVYINIKDRFNDTIYITMVNPQGQLIYKQRINNTTEVVNLCGLPAGLYYIIIHNTATNGYAQKLVIR